MAASGQCTQNTRTHTHTDTRTHHETKGSATQDAEVKKACTIQYCSHRWYSSALCSLMALNDEYAGYSCPIVRLHTMQSDGHQMESRIRQVRTGRSQCFTIATPQECFVGARHENNMMRKAGTDSIHTTQPGSRLRVSFLPRGAARGSAVRAQFREAMTPSRGALSGASARHHSGPCTPLQSRLSSFMSLQLVVPVRV